MGKTYKNSLQAIEILPCVQNLSSAIHMVSSGNQNITCGEFSRLSWKGRIKKFPMPQHFGKLFPNSRINR